MRIIAANVGKNDNEGSAVVQVGFGKHSVLLMGKYFVQITHR